MNSIIDRISFIIENRKDIRIHHLEHKLMKLFEKKGSTKVKYETAYGILNFIKK